MKKKRKSNRIKVGRKKVDLNSMGASRRQALAQLTLQERWALRLAEVKDRVPVTDYIQRCTRWLKPEKLARLLVEGLIEERGGFFYAVDRKGVANG